MKNSDIKNIIFDFGGVILNIDHELTEEAFRKLGINDFDKLYSKAIQSNLFDDLEKGTISADNFIKEIKKIINVSESDIVNAWNAILLDIPKERIEILKKVKNNYRTFLLSNTNIIHYEKYVADLEKVFGHKDFSPLFEKSYFSYQVGMRKPNKEIFEYVLLQNGLKPEETLFIDDSIQHIHGAEKTGIKTYFLKAGEDISVLFENGILV